MEGYLLALDQGTTSSRAIVFERNGTVRALAQKEFRQYYPHPGWVEQDPMEIWATQVGVAGEALARIPGGRGAVAALGITNQRETTVVWDRHTGEPVCRAIVWQCRRTRDICHRLLEEGHGDTIREKTGLVVDSYFSGTKIRWILDEIPGARKKADAGDLLFGTIDSWLLWNLTGGRVHATDISNASRTMLYNIRTRAWDEELLGILGIPRSMLPEVRDSSGVLGDVRDSGHGLEGIPVGGMIGDQQGALFGQGCLEAGQAKNTYGTGCFLLMNVGSEPVMTDAGLLSTVAWSIGGRVTYALEGSIFIGGAVVQWLRDGLGLIREASQTEEMARAAGDNGGVYLVPAFTGLGAPHWDMDARGLLIGLTRGTNRNHVVRAALEAIAYQTRDVVLRMEEVSGVPLGVLRVDGGAVQNDFLMEFQSGILGRPVVRPAVTETTAFGAAALAGLAVGYYQDPGELQDLIAPERTFEPGMDPRERTALCRGWQRAVERAAKWIE